MKQKNSGVCMLALLAFLLCGCSCSASAPQRKTPIRVTLMADDTYVLAEGYQHQADIAVGSEVRFVLYPAKGFVITGTDYPGGIAADGPSGSTVLILPSVRYPTRVRVICEKDSNVRSITYHANGGCWQNGEEERLIHHALNGHLFPNTDSGQMLQRERHMLIGWNTLPDGTGKHIGLGSRCWEPSEAGLTLYAEWLPWSDTDQFIFREEENGWTLLAYEGDEPTVAVPDTVNGLAVRRVAEGAFTGKSISLLSLPVNLEAVAPGAFSSCAIEQMYFFDNLLSFPDAAFRETPIPRTHVNAAQPPRYSGAGRASNYADKIDLLKLHADEKKIVLFGGSGTFYSVLASEMQRQLNGEYTVLNLGMNGWFPAIPQLQAIRPFLRKGDILLHIPEMSSATQLFSDVRFAFPVEDPSILDDRYMRSLELNYDLIAGMDLRETEGFFDSFSRFNRDRQSQAPTSYSDCSHYISEQGDYAGRKLSYQADEAITREADIRPELLTKEALERMNRMYQGFTEAGIRVAVAYAAVNESALAQIPGYLDKAEAFQEQLKNGVRYGTVIENITDAFYPGHVFYNSDWHLSEEADVQNTTRITEGLKEWFWRTSDDAE